MWTVPIPFHSLIAQPKQMLCRQGCWRDCHLCKTVEMPTGRAAHNPLRLRQCRPIFGPRNHKTVVSVQFNWRPFPGPFPPIPLTVLLPPGPDLVAVYIELYILSEVRRDLPSKSNQPTNQPTTNHPTKNQPTDRQPSNQPDGIWRHKSWSTLIHVMVACSVLFGAKPSHEPILAYCRLGTMEQTTVALESKWQKYFVRRNVFEATILFGPQCANLIKKN